MTTQVLGVLVAIALVIALIFAFAAAERVEAGSACVVLRNGQRVGTADPGLNWRMPGLHTFECYQTRTLNLEVGGTEASRANYRDDVVSLKSSDGVNINVSAMVYVRIPKENLGDIYDTYGRSQDEVFGRHVQPDTRDAIRMVIEQKPVDDVYLGGLDATSAEIEERLREQLGAKGIELESFALTVVDPSDEYKAAIQNQVEEQQSAQLEAERVEVEKQRAEQKKVAAQGDADAKIIAAEGDAEANRIVSESLTPELLQLKAIEALETVNWAILPSGDVETMLPINPPEATPEG